LAHKEQPHPLVILHFDFSSCSKVQRLARICLFWLSEYREKHLLLVTDLLVDFLSCFGVFV
jgi:hypothetical protein